MNEYDKGWDDGFAAGYAKGRATTKHEKESQANDLPTLTDLKGNGWIQIDDDLRKEFKLSDVFTKAYVIQGINGFVTILEVA